MAGIAAARTLQDASFQVLFVLLQNQMQFHVLGRYTLETDFDHHRFLNGCVVFLSFQVTVLESRDRIGGRVHTDYSFGFPVDLGASW